ncbi:MAG: tRNA (adenosine(37)-N6)-threonylcarbamoyltransferase complex ATPase subunit type 1 TsaE [Spirochaetaceae bacterium]
MKVYRSASPEETRRVAAVLAAELRAGSVIALHGDLGSGKTTFVKGLAAALGVQDLVTSPSFSLIQEYEGQVPFFHVDLYRLQGPQEVELLDLAPVLDAGGITVIEWAERAGDTLPEHAIHVTLRVEQDAARSITVEEPA